MKKQIFWEDEYSYDLEVKDNIYTLYYSNNECWQSNFRNTVALKMINTGNEFIFEGLDKKHKLNYSEAVQMYILLAFEKDYKVEMSEKIREL